MCEKSSLSRTAINKLRAAGQFPDAVPISEKRIAFVEKEVDESDLISVWPPDAAGSPSGTEGGMTVVSDVRVMLKMCQDISMEVIRHSRDADFSLNTREAAGLSSFTDALVKWAGSAVTGRPPSKRTETVLKRWGGLSLSQRLFIAGKATETGCANLLAEAVGDLPEPEQQDVGRRTYDPMF